MESDGSGDSMRGCNGGLQKAIRGFGSRFYWQPTFCGVRVAARTAAE